MDAIHSYPLTHHQRLLWLAQQIHADIPLFHIAISFRIRGALDARRFTRAFNDTIAETDSLRTVIRDGPDGEPWAHVLPEVRGGLRYRDVRTNPLVEGDFDQHLESFIWQPFDADRRLFESRLFRLDEEDFCWVLRMHHVVSDGVSFQLIFDRVETRYRGADPGPSPPAYHEYARSGAARPDPSAQAYWRGRLPELLDDFYFYGRAPGEDVHPTVRCAQSFSPDRLETIDARCPDGVSQNAHRFNFFAAVYAVYLARLSGAAAPALAMVHHGRSHPAFRETVGFFTRVLPLRTSIGREDTLTDVMESVRREAVQAARNASGAITNTRFERIIHTSVNLRVTHFQTFAGMPIEPTSHHAGWSDLPLALNIHDFSGRTVDVSLDISKHLLPQDSLRTDAASRLFRMCDHFLDHPDAPVRIAPVLTAGERRRLLVDFQPAAVPVPVEGIGARVAAIAAERPDSPAFRSGVRTLSYGELNRRANRLAHRLLDLAGPGPEPIGIHLDAGLLLPIAVLAALRAGRPFLQLPPGLPDARAARMIAASGAAWILSDGFDPTRHDPAPAVIQVRGVLQDQTIPDHEPETGLGLDDVLYIAYTSGSSGRPKGIRVPQRQLINLLENRWNRYPVGPDEVLCHKSYPGFVDSTIELFEGLLQGRPTVFIGEKTIRDPDALVDALAEHRVTRTRFIPEHLAALVETVPRIGERLPDLRLIANTAAAIRPDTLARFLVAFPGRIFINTFGLSELVGVAIGEIDPGDAENGRLPVGRPIPNRQVYVLDPLLEPVPIGVPGELFLGGDDLPAGFIGGRETEKALVPDPFHPGEVLLHTGDIARWREDGRLEYLGRRDHQVKVRGQRVELQEVEAALAELPGVRRAAVNPWERNGRTLLAGYIVPDGAPQDPAEIRERLARRLPDYMIPANFVFLKELPRTSSGKIDRRSLPEPERLAQPDDIAVPTNRTEARLVEIWREMLGVEHIGRNTDTLALGGDSLLAMRIRSQLNREFDVDIPIGAFVEAVTIAGQARLVEDARRGLPLGQRLIPLRSSGDRPPLFMVPPAGSTVLTFMKLVRHLPAHQPVYGLQPWGIEGEIQPHYSVRKMAADYILEMRRIRPEGPFLLAGMCFGGVVVYEIARQLRREGTPAALTVVIDTLVAPRFPFRERIRGIGRLAKRLVVNRWSMPEVVVTRLRKQSPSKRVSDRELRHIDRVYRANALGRYLYFPAGRYPGRLEVVFSGAPPAYGNREDWQHAAEDVNIQVISGQHAGDKSILREPQVRILAEHLAGLVEKAQSNQASMASSRSRS